MNGGKNPHGSSVWEAKAALDVNTEKRKIDRMKRQNVKKKFKKRRKEKIQRARERETDRIEVE